MEERYTRLFSLPENLYSAGAPVMIAAGALLKDNQTGKVLAQLKLRSLVDQKVKAVKVKIAPLDMVGKPLGETVDHLYLDLNASRDVEFGQKVPIPLPDATTRGFQASVLEVVFADNTLWAAGDAPWEPISAPVPLAQALADDELAKQYRIQYGEDSVNLFHPERDLWRCACGALNHQNEPVCHKCHKQAAALAALDLEKLKADRDKRLEMEQQKAAEEKAIAEAKSKKIKTLAMTVVPIAVIIIVAVAVIFENSQKADAYNRAMILIEQGDYESATTAFEKLGDYKDSEKIVQQLNNEMTAYEYVLEALEVGEIYYDDLALFVNTDFQYLKPDELIIELANSVYPYIGIWEYISGDPSVLSMDESMYAKAYTEYYSFETNIEIEGNIEYDTTANLWINDYEIGGIWLFDFSLTQEFEPFNWVYQDDGDGKIFMTSLSDDKLQVTYISDDGNTTLSAKYQRGEW